MGIFKNKEMTKLEAKQRIAILEKRIYWIRDNIIGTNKFGPEYQYELACAIDDCENLKSFISE